MDVDRLQALYTERMHDENFVVLGPRRGELHVSGNCTQPVTVVRWSRAHGETKKWGKGAKPAPMMEITFFTRCRRCPACQQQTAREWRARAINEIEASARTWFGTLTLSPASHYVVDTICATRERDFWSLPQEKKFAAQSKVAGAEVTKWLKRVRKQADLPFRYLLAVERHDSAKTSIEMRNRPHMHILVHEYEGLPLKKSILRDQWEQLGFSRWKLTDGIQGAFYVTKYITKSVECRLRASIDYGRNDGPNYEGVQF